MINIGTISEKNNTIIIILSHYRVVIFCIILYKKLNEIYTSVIMDSDYIAHAQKLHDLISSYVNNVEYKYNDYDVEYAIVKLNIEKYISLRNEIKSMFLNKINDSNISMFVRRLSIEDGVITAIINTDNIYYAPMKNQPPPES